MSRVAVLNHGFWNIMQAVSFATKMLEQRSNVNIPLQTISVEWFWSMPSCHGTYTYRCMDVYHTNSYMLPYIHIVMVFTMCLQQFGYDMISRHNKTKITVASLSFLSVTFVRNDDMATCAIPSWNQLMEEWVWRRSEKQSLTSICTRRRQVYPQHPLSFSLSHTHVHIHVPAHAFI